ncbi:MAG: hypothetical protein ABIE07_01475 [Candidatus Zixiibacteriota bacterium]
MSNKYDSRKNEYRTTDIYLTSFLIAAEHTRLVCVEPSGMRRKIFVLQPYPDEKILQSFYSKGKSSRIAALTIMNELRNLKAIIMAQHCAPKGGDISEWC